MAQKNEIPEYYSMLDNSAEESVKDFYKAAFVDGRRNAVKKMIERVGNIPLTPADRKLVIEMAKSILFL